MATTAWDSAWSARLLDHNDVDVALQPELAGLERGCRRALQRQLEWQASAVEAQPAATPYAQKIAVPHDWQPQAPPPDSKDRGVSIAYLIMGHRSFAHATIARLIHVLWHPAHTFLVHLDARTNHSVAADLRQRFGTSHRANVHIVGDTHRRPIGWGSFAMVELLLSSIATALAAHPSFDFFINLSDCDVPLRTNREIVAFLTPFKGRSFVATKFPEADSMRYRAHAHMRASTWLECEGEGFLIINRTAEEFFGNGAESRRCCYARSGPIVYAPPGQLGVDRPPPPTGWSFFHGSQWVVLAREAAEWLVTSPRVADLARHTRLTYMADESFVQTALQHSPFGRHLVNHNLRYIDWPHGYGDPNAYWMAMGARHVSGPMVLTERLLPSVAASPALFARKVDLEDEGGRAFVLKWEAWMAAKLAIEEEEEEEEARNDSSGDSSDSGAAEDASMLDAGGGGGARLAAARLLLASMPRQPTIAEPLLSGDPMLQALRPPPTPDEMMALSPAEVSRRSAPRSVHFGHEDLMEKQFRPDAADGAAGSLPQAADFSRRHRLAEDEGEQGRAAEARLAEVLFADGSRCSCAAGCGRKGQEACCREWDIGRGGCAAVYAPTENAVE